MSGKPIIVDDVSGPKTITHADGIVGSHPLTSLCRIMDKGKCQQHLSNCTINMQMSAVANSDGKTLL